MLRFGILLSVAVMACSEPSIAFSELDHELQQARCERFSRCGLFPDEASCTAFFRVVPDVSIAGAITAGKIEFDGEQAKRCVDAIATQSCDLTAREVRLGPAACTEMFVGKVAGGETCSIDTECASGTCELPAQCPELQCCYGTCRPTHDAATAGGSCARNQDCIDGLVCGADLICHTPAADGASCGADRECGEGLGCIGALPAGTCRPLAHLGEPCPYQRCAEENLRCDGETHRCVALGLPGDACVSSADCSIYMECDTATQQCRESPKLGMPCDGECGGEAFCRFDLGGAATCVALLENKTPCDGNQECLSAFCEDGPIFRSCIDPYVCF